MLRFSPRRLGPRLGALLASLAAIVALSACGSSTASTTGGHDSPQAAAQGFLSALGAYDGSPASLTALLDWVPPSRRAAAQQTFTGLGAAGTTTRFKLENVQIGNATISGNTATVRVQAKLSICVSGSVGTQTFSTCPPAPVSPTGDFDTLTCESEQGQWYGADYSSSANSGTSTPTAAPTPGGSGSASTGSAPAGTTASAST
jgi:hypothetical protein